jgi:hypothetical protein
MQHLENFLSRLDGVTRSGSGWKARCPSEKHGNKGIDNKPSLSVSLGEDNKILLFCFAGCSSEDIVADMGLEFRDLWPRTEDQINNTDVPAVVQKAQPPASGKNPSYHVLEAGFGETIDADLYHKVYNALLDKLTLTSDHRDNLNKRGLNDEQIDRRGYRSLTFFKFRQSVSSLREQFGEALSNVPGFKTKTEEDVTAVTMPNGIIIPARDVEGRIIALLIRANNDNQASKYLWFSGGDVSSNAPAHVPLGVGPAEVIRVTEGPLKADIAFSLDKVPTIAISGVTNWNRAFPILGKWKPKTVRLAFDADAQNNKSVALAVQDLASVLKTEHAIEVEVWPLEQGKGIDDVLFAGGTTKVLTGDDAIHFIRGLGEEKVANDVAEPVPAPVGETTSTSTEEPVPKAELATAVQESIRGPDRFPYGAGDPVPFPLDVLPEPLQQVVQEIATAVNSPLDFPGCAMIAAAATAIGRSRQIEPLADWQICPRLYIGMVGDPGSSKTPAAKKIMDPLWKKNQKWIQQYRDEMEGYDLAKWAYEEEIKEFVKHAPKSSKAKTRKEQAVHEDDDDAIGTA